MSSLSFHIAGGKSHLSRLFEELSWIGMDIILSAYQWRILWTLLYVLARTHTHTLKQTMTFIRTGVCARARAHTHTQRHTHIHTRTYTHAHTHTHTHIWMHARVCTTHTHTHTHIHWTQNLTALNEWSFIILYPTQRLEVTIRSYTVCPHHNCYT